MSQFKLKAKFKPSGSQPKAIKQLIAGLKRGDKYQTLLGVTGSGKTFTMANVIAEIQKPTLVIAPNKTLTAQLCNEYRSFFPKAAVEYFVSYYDYYQPEAYLPSTDTYIEKDAQINQEIDRLRHATTQAVLSRKDVIVCATVSAIYGIGSPEEYLKVSLPIEVGKKYSREDLILDLVNRFFTRTHQQLERGRFRVRGEIFEIMPTDRESIIRIELEDNIIKNISEINSLTRQLVNSPNKIIIYAAKHFVTPQDQLERAIKAIKLELKQRVEYFKKNHKLIEAERLERRTNFDLEMLKEMGYCNGIENYSRLLSGRPAGSPPETLIDYFKRDFLLIIDESHITIPQLNGMYAGDRSRKESLIKYGFRLPSAADNRPLKFDEFSRKINRAVFTSATPADFERQKSGQIVEQIIRPTGLVDPEVEIRPEKGQINDLIKEITERVKKNERVLVTTLTRKMAEDLSEYLAEHNIKTRYLHYQVETLDRIETLTDLRKGKFDVLVGINLLREGLDLPEVSLVAILDADKEGFLRSETSLVQTIGRTARNVRGKVILYAEEITGSMKRAIAETDRRRKIQFKYNKKHHITPATIKKAISDIVPARTIGYKRADIQAELMFMDGKIENLIKEKEKEMKTAAKDLNFEVAAVIRDEIVELKRLAKEKARISI